MKKQQQGGGKKNLNIRRGGVKKHKMKLSQPDAPAHLVRDKLIGKNKNQVGRETQDRPRKSTGERAPERRGRT